MIAASRNGASSSSPTCSFRFPRSHPIYDLRIRGSTSRYATSISVETTT